MRLHFPGYGGVAFSESKPHDVLLGFGIDRRWQRLLSNVVEPDWVTTRIRRKSTPDDLHQAHRTQVWLAARSDPKAKVTAGYFDHLQRREVRPEAL